MTEPMRYLSPRLIDYVAVVGSSEPGVGEDGTPPLPQLLRRYPAEDHADFPLPADTSYFCQPDGCLSVGAKRLSLRDSSSFVFALTEKDSGRRRYGTCLNFYRPFRRKYGGQRVPVAAKPTDVGVASNLAGEPQLVRSSLSTVKEPPVPAARQLRSHTLTSLCIVSHHGLFSSFRECLRVLRRLISLCNAHLNGCRKSARVPKNAVWNFLIGKLMEVPPAALPYIRELEMFILRLLSVPVPVPGKTRLELSVLPPELMSPPLVMALPDHTRFSLIDFPLHLPLELLGVDSCIRVLECIVLEQKVLLQSRDHNALSMSVMALIVMLYPLEYMFPVIPLLPTCMESAEQLLLAPTPFVIGVPATFFQQRRGFVVPDDVWVVDLDANTMRQPTAKGCDLPAMPEPETTQLRNYLKQSLSCMSLASSQPVKNLDALLESTSSHSLPRKPSEMGLAFNPFIFGNDPDSVDVATRVALVHFFCAPNVLANFQEHARVLRLYPRPVVAFQLNSFLRSRPVLSPFTELLAKTQAIEFFAEWALNPTNVAFMRVLTGVYDPTLVGDKVRWYGHHMQTVSHAIYSSNSPLNALVVAVTGGKDAVDDPTDESGESEEEPGMHRINNGVAVPCRGSPHVAGCARLTTVAERDVFSPPTHLPSPASIATSGSSGRFSPGYGSDSDESGLSDAEVVTSDADSTYLTQSNKEKLMASSSEDTLAVTSSAKNKPEIAGRKSMSMPTAVGPSSEKAPLSPSSLLSNLSSDIGNYAMNASSKLSGLLDTVGDKIQTIVGSPPPATTGALRRPSEHVPATTLADSSSTDAVTTSPSRQGLVRQATYSKEVRELQRQHADHPSWSGGGASAVAAEQGIHGENQVFLKETIGRVMNGGGVSWMKSSKVRKLMEDENYRNFVLSRLNGHLDKKLSSSEEQVMEDVVLSKSVCKGVLAVLKSIVSGLEHTWKTDGRGGVASALMVLEIAHTHYFLLDGSSGPSRSSNSSRSSSPYGSRESLASSSTTGRESSSSRHASRNNNRVQESILTSSTGPYEGDDKLPSIAVNNDVSHPEDARTSPLAGPDMTRNDGCSPASHPAPKPRRRSAASSSGKSDMDLRLAADGGSTGGSGPPSRMNSPGRSPISHQSLRKVSSERDSPSEAITNFSKNVITSDLIKKSQLSSGFRYLDGSLLHVSQGPAQSGHIDNSAASVSSVKIYLFEGMLGKSRSSLWDQMQFWEDVFLDAVAQEREMIGLDQEPAELIERYVYLGEYERRRLEQEEDRLLATMLYNHAAFMLMMGCNKTEARKKVRRLLGRSHIGLLQSQLVNSLLDHIDQLTGNDVDLKPLPSRMIQKQSFSVHLGTDNAGEMLFMEVCDDCIILRCVSGAIVDRWWYEKLVNMTYSPKTRVLCLWRRDSEQTTQLSKFYTKKCRDLYGCIKDAMEKAASRQQEKVPGPELGGEFAPVIDMVTGKSGTLRVCVEGVGFTQDDYEERELFVELDRIKKCFAQKGGMFILEELDANTGHILQRKYMSSVADQICYAILCVFSYVAAGTDQAKSSSTVELEDNHSQA